MYAPTVSEQRVTNNPKSLRFIGVSERCPTTAVTGPPPENKRDFKIRVIGDSGSPRCSVIRSLGGFIGKLKFVEYDLFDKRVKIPALVERFPGWNWFHPFGYLKKLLIVFQADQCTKA